jgi:hypothetical protein
MTTCQWQCTGRRASYEISSCMLDNACMSWYGTCSPTLHVYCVHRAISSKGGKTVSCPMQPLGDSPPFLSTCKNGFHHSPTASKCTSYNNTLYIVNTNNPRYNDMCMILWLSLIHWPSLSFTLCVRAAQRWFHYRAFQIAHLPSDGLGTVVTYSWTARTRDRNERSFIVMNTPVIWWPSMTHMNLSEYSFLFVYTIGSDCIQGFPKISPLGTKSEIGTRPSRPELWCSNLALY